MTDVKQQDQKQKNDMESPEVEIDETELDDHDADELENLEDELLEETTDDVTEDDEVEKLRLQLQLAQEMERRAQADYQNLLRRSQEERVKFLKLAGREVIESLLQPLDHLYMAQAQLKDKGLDIVCQQFTQALTDLGVTEIAAVGEEFNLETMEVIDKVEVQDQKEVDRVVKVAQKGYRLHGEVIRHAKVLVGIKK